MKYLLGFMIALVAILGGFYIWVTWVILGILVKGLLLVALAAVLYFGLKAVKDVD